ncbi:hypothetical protein GUJ93_ZPchr0009g402 [Zizania palustris]|uniref:Uncharacterized protein n=1 Tax=Zizania palustris TaxID=103762 RepID=A0A8J5VLW0_ZIZPA|nr:hypothetical protein GUJ93_ZPchr0009g402 [Zizania palustris]
MDAAMEKQQHVLPADSSNGKDDDDDAAGRHRGWKAMTYVIGNETFEKLGTIGTTANMLVYLTTVYHMHSVDAVTLLNFFTGTTNLAPLLGAFLCDTYLGRYNTLAAASISSFLGMLLLTLTAAVRALHPPPCASTCQRATPWQLSALLASFAFLVVGAGGIRPCNLAFGADQFDPRTHSGRRGIAICQLLQLSNVNWAIGLAVPAALMGLSCALFFMGTRLYVRVRPEGSPFTSFVRVLVAAARKRRLPPPVSADDLFDPPHHSKLVAKIAYTDQFRCLDKAAVVTPEDTVQVEEVKCLARIIPVWSAGIVYFIVLTQVSTYVVFQAMQSDRRLGTSGFEVPPGSFVVFNMLAMTAWIPVYDRVVVPALRRVTGREGGISQLQRIGIALALSVATMLVAAAVERRRRRIGASMLFFWLVPQQVLAGMSEAFAAIGLNELCYKQFPENMRSVAGALFFLTFAVASYASGFMVAAVHRTTGWLAQDLNKGRLDLFYLLVAAIAAANLVYFVVCARWYRFKKISNTDDDDELQLSGRTAPAPAPPTS